MRRRRRSFFLVIVDDDAKTFCVVGPMSDDTEWNHRIVELQEVGRDIRCFSTEASKSVKAIADLYSKQTGFSYSEDLIIHSPADSSTSYVGALPDYAKNATRSRLVRLLCRGRCNTTRWAEMDTDYPGQQALSNSQEGKFTATCLKCGERATDPYNWFR